MTLLSPIRSSDGKAVLPIKLSELPRLLLSEQTSWPKWADEVEHVNKQFKFSSKDILVDLKYRRRLITAIESYLMANRGALDFEGFKEHVRGLASSTLAFQLASAEQKEALIILFDLVADHVQQVAPVPQKQAAYAKTLLGVDAAIAIEIWVEQNRERLLTLTSNEDWLMAVWALLSQQIDDKFFSQVEPRELPVALAINWMNGVSYGELIAIAYSQNGTKPWGKKRRRLTEADVVDFVESTLGFDCSLILAAVAQSLFGTRGLMSEEAAAISLFQKSIKYGLPDWLSISCVELGFADRAVAIGIRDCLILAGYSDAHAGMAMNSHRNEISIFLESYPSYFKAVLDSIKTTQ